MQSAVGLGLAPDAVNAKRTYLEIKRSNALHGEGIAGNGIPSRLKKYSKVAKVRFFCLPWSSFLQGET